MDHILLLVFGIFLVILGNRNRKGDISTIHSYNRRKVKDEDVPKYGKAVGNGTVIIGLSFILGFFLSFGTELLMAWILLSGVLVGLALILYGQFKYNKGIF